MDERWGALISPFSSGSLSHHTDTLYTRFLRCALGRWDRFLCSATAKPVEEKINNKIYREKRCAVILTRKSNSHYAVPMRDAAGLVSILSSVYVVCDGIRVR